MSEMKYPELFEPFKIGDLTIKNRIVMSPMDPKRDPKGHPYCDETIAYLAERVKGGAGLIVTGVLTQKYNIEGGLAVPTEFKYEDELRRQMPKLVREVHRYGAKVFIQLWLNFGRICFPISVDKRIAVSEGPNLWAPELTNRALKAKEIEKIIASNVEAAKFCKDCGVDGVTIVGPYGGYLPDQFGTALFNHRTDKYGGSVEARSQATSEMIRGIKESCGEDFPVLVRMGTRHHIEGVHKGQIPGKPYKEAGRDIDESIELAKYYVKAGADGFLCANGCYDALYWQYSPCYLPEGEWIDEIAPLTNAVDVPVMCSGRILVPEIANTAIKEGKITAAVLGRPLLADPYWAQKAKEGRPEDIRPCIGCNNGCIGRVMNAEPIMCAVNGNLYHESEPEIIPADKPKKVAVIGAGVGGMETARIAKLRGHDVEIYEKGDKVGGLFIAATVPDFKHGDERLLKWYEKQMKDLEIPIHFGCEMDRDKILALGADEVIVATGSFPKCPPIPGLSEAKPVVAADVLTGKSKAGKNIVMLGAGLIGCETAMHLAQDDNVHVTMVELGRYIMTNGLQQPPTVNLEYWERMLDWKSNIDLMLRSKVTKVEDGHVTVEKIRGGVTEVPFDSIVLAVGMGSEQTLFNAIKDYFGDHVHLVGDANEFGNILTAVQRANEVAKAI